MERTNWHSVPCMLEKYLAAEAQMAGMHARYADLRALVAAALARWVASGTAGAAGEAAGGPHLLPLPPALEAALAADVTAALAPAAQVGAL